MEHTLFCPLAIRGLHELADVTPAHALAAFRGLAHEARVDLKVVRVRSHPEVGSAADGIPEGGEQVDQDRHRVGLGVGLDGLDDLAWQPVKRLV